LTDLHRLKGPEPEMDDTFLPITNNFQLES